MAYDFRTSCQVPFVDTDLAGIVHFSNFFRYMEAAEHAFYRSLGFDIHQRDAELSYGFPRLQVACKFHSPLFFGDEVDVHLLVREVRERTIRYQFIFSKNHTPDEQVVARGKSTIACIAFENGQARMKSVPFPEELRKQLEEAPADLLEL